MSNRQRTATGRKAETEQAEADFRIHHGAKQFPTNRRLIDAMIEELEAHGFSDLVITLMLADVPGGDPKIKAALELLIETELATGDARAKVIDRIDAALTVDGVDVIDNVRASEALRLAEGMSDRRASEIIARREGGGANLEAAAKRIRRGMAKLREG